MKLSEIEDEEIEEVFFKGIRTSSASNPERTKNKKTFVVFFFNKIKLKIFGL